MPCKSLHRFLLSVMALSLVGCTPLAMPTGTLPTGSQGDNPLTTVPPLTTVAPLTKSSVADLQQISALSALSAFKGANGTVNLGTVGSPIYSIFAIPDATASWVPLDEFELADAGSRMRESESSLRWSFAIEQGFRAPEGGAGAFMGSTSVFSAADELLEEGSLTMYYQRDPGWEEGEWSGTDDMIEEVVSSSIRPVGRYVRERSLVQRNVGDDEVQEATESITFSPTGGTSGVASQQVRSLTRLASGDEVYRNQLSGRVPSGLSFLKTSEGTQSIDAMAFSDETRITLADGRYIQTLVRLTGTPDPVRRVPQSIDPDSAIRLAMHRADGSLLVLLAIDDMEPQPAERTMRTRGQVLDGEGKKVATFEGVIGFSTSTWRGKASFIDDTEASLNLDAVAQALTR